MITKFVFGNPFETGAVVETSEIVQGQLSDFMYETCESNENFIINIPLEKDEAIFGLGENVRGINKRGWIYDSWCSDDPNHDEDKRSLYGAHNFFILSGSVNRGIFIDFPGKITFDAGYTDKDMFTITITDGNFLVYVIDGDGMSLKEITKSFRRIIGKSYIPPRWAFGYQQSRWGYMNQSDIEAVVEEYKKCGIPLDAVYMDIDYMDSFKDFTINEERFPEFPKFVNEMKEQNIHLVPIIDAGVKIEKGYATYEEGVKNNFFCKDADGNDFVCGVWPGHVHMPDFLNAKTRKWFGDSYKVLTDAGIDGFWNDMNEPALFYSEKRLGETIDKLKSYNGTDYDVWEIFGLRDLVNDLANNEEDYRSFYHMATTDDGEIKVRHDKVHNLFGYNMTKAAAESMKDLRPNKRTLLFSRASYIGMHRYSGIWTGDNKSWWSHILLMINMLPSLNMCGFMYIGADMGGFGSNATEELVTRWVESSMWVPLMRNHAALGTREQELYQFKDKETFRRLIEIRYSLIPYLYSEFLKCHAKDELMYTPLAFEFPDDPFARECEDQLLVGESVMICPIYTPNSTGRYVYLPEDMTLVRMRAWNDYELVPYKTGHHYIHIGLSEFVFFIRKGKALPFANTASNTSKLDISTITLLRGIGGNYDNKGAFVTEMPDYELWWDDGESTDCPVEVINLK